MRVVVSLRLEKLSLSEIADAMNTAQYKTPSGLDVWNRHIVFDLLHTRHAQEYMKVANSQPSSLFNDLGAAI